MKKGQYFIIATVFIIIAIILIKGMFGFFEIAKERKFHEGTFLEKNLKNIEKEYEYLIGITSLQADPKTSGISNLWNFSYFIMDNTDSKILYMFVFSNTTEQKYYVTVGNFLGDAITATLNVTNSTITGVSLGTISDRKNSTAQFDASINGMINITLTYSTKTEQVIEKIPITTAANSVYGFFDIKLDSKNFIIRTKDTYNRTL